MSERDFNCCTPFVLTGDRIAIGNGAAAAPYSIALGTCAVSSASGQVTTTAQLYSTAQDRADMNLVQILYTLAEIQPRLSDSDYIQALKWLNAWLGGSSLC